MGPFTDENSDPLFYVREQVSAGDMAHAPQYDYVPITEDNIPTDLVNMIYGSKLQNDSQFGNIASSGIDTLLRNAISMISQRQSVDEQRRYNSPAAQVQRLKDAGINPYSVLGNIASNNVGDRRPSLHVQDLDFLERAQKLELQDAQIANIRQQNRVVKRNADLLDMRYSRERATFQESIANLLTNYAKVELQNQLMQGKITYQDYANQIKELNAQFEKDIMSTPQWMMDTASNSDTFADFVNQLPPKYAQMLVVFGNTLAAMNYTNVKSSREAIAADYENRMGMPFSNMSDLGVILHLLNAFMPKLFDRGRTEVKSALGIE